MASFSAVPLFEKSQSCYDTGLPIFHPQTLPSEGGVSMPKMKTHKGTKKRFRVTATGKFKHRAAGTSHLASRMSKKRRRKLRGTRVLHKSVNHQISRALAHNSL
jgi:large subunit ribosomal protein L35